MAVNVLLVVAIVAAAGYALVVALGAALWRSGTRELRARLEATRTPIEPRVVDFKELEKLPAPVQRYLRKVLTDGQPIVAASRVNHRGKFNIDENAERWKPFVSEQRVVTRRRGFDWNARVTMLPGLSVHVHDAYVSGEGTLHAAFLGLFTLASIKGTRDVAEGQLMRWFAEAAWYPTALLPGQGVRWQAIDDRSARGVLVDDGVTIAMHFTFDKDDLIETVRADARGRAVGGQVVPTPWQGRFWNYAVRDGMTIPLDAEVAWILPEGPKPYWRGRITKVEYEFAG